MRWLGDASLARQLPWALRIWAGYLRFGPRRLSGGTFGGSAAYRIALMLVRPNAGHGARLVRLVHPAVKYGVTVNLRDFEVFNHTLDLWLYGSAESRLLTTVLRPDSVFLDVGANYGIYALIAASVGGKHVKVYAFEPQPALASALADSVLSNEITNLVPVTAAVSSHAGRLEFFVPLSGSGVGSILRKHAQQQSAVATVQVDAISLDDFAKDRGLKQVDIIKVDVEGAELDVFDGATWLLGHYRPIVWFEVNPATLDSAKHSARALFSALERCGYTHFYDVAAIDAGEWTRIDLDAPVAGLINVVALPAQLEAVLAENRPRVES